MGSKYTKVTSPLKKKKNKSTPLVVSKCQNQLFKYYVSLSPDQSSIHTTWYVNSGYLLPLRTIPNLSCNPLRSSPRQPKWATRRKTILKLGSVGEMVLVQAQSVRYCRKDCVSRSLVDMPHHCTRNTFPLMIRNGLQDIYNFPTIPAWPMI